MKQMALLLTALTLLLPIGSLCAKEAAQHGAGKITVGKLPGSVTEFLTLRKKLSVTPQGGGALFITALMIYTRNENLGRKCIVIAIDRSRLQRSAQSWYRGSNRIAVSGTICADSNASRFCPEYM